MTNCPGILGYMYGPSFEAVPTYQIGLIMARIHQGVPNSFTRETSQQPRLAEHAVIWVVPGPLKPKVQTEQLPKNAQGRLFILNERGHDMET